MLYYLSAEDRRLLEPVTQISLADAGWDEKDMENLIAGNIDRVVREDQVMVIAQERQWQAEADIMAIDEKGDLYLFELKRWQSTQEDILQVLRLETPLTSDAFNTHQHFVVVSG